MTSNPTKKLRRLAACFLVSLTLLTTTPPVFAGPVEPEHRRIASAPIPRAPQPKGGVRTGPHKLTVISSKFVIADNPTDLELTTCRAFQEPLAPVTGSPLAGENAALAKALKEFKTKNNLEDVSDLTGFIEAFPKSRWAPSVEANVGSLRFQTGYLSDALSLWASAWEGSRAETGRDQVAIASGAFANLVNINARLGRQDDLHKYFAEAGTRPFFGTNELKVKGARDGLQFMQRKPEKAFKCGPYAVNALLMLKSQGRGRDPILDKAQSTSKGTTLTQVKGWADQVGLKYQMAKRSKGAAFVCPAIAHLKLDHFAAIVGMDNGRYHIQDPTFDSDSEAWVSPAALEAETDGYFLIPVSDHLLEGWQPVTPEEAKSVIGKGTSVGRNAPPGHCSVSCGCSADGGGGGGDGGGDGGGGGDGMAKASAFGTQATLVIKDAPLKYSCPLAGSGTMRFSVNYNDLEAGQPSSFSWSNLGFDWSMNWVSYLTVDTSSVATVRLRTGGIEIYPQSGGVYSNNNFSHALLVNTGTNAYTRTMPDGTVETFNQADTASPPHIFMTSVTTPQGQTSLIQYDVNFRATSVTDPVGQVSTISYVSNTVGNVGFYKISGISDPFSRTCSFAYDSTTTTLVSITDQIGLVSKFAYDSSSSMITQMSTAYGTTSFYQYVPGADTYPPQGLKTTYPDGSWSVIENWLNETKSTYYWDRHATQLYPNDPANKVYTHCEVTKYVVNAVTGLEGTAAQNATHPLESLSPIYYTHPGQTNGPDYEGTSDLPAQITRSLGNQVVDATIGGSVTVGDYINIGLVSDVSIFYTMVTGDTPSTIATNIAAAINASSAMRGEGVTAGAAGPIVSMHSDTLNKFAYFATVSSGGTETVGLRSHVKQTAVATLTGTSLVNGDILTFNVTTPWPHEGGQQTFTHTVAVGDTLTSIVSDFASQANANTILQAFGFVATASGAVMNIVSYNEEIQAYSFGNQGSGNALLTFSNIYNGAKELENYTYNQYGRVTQSIDSVGRTFSYSYASNNIDLLQKKETKGTDNFQMGAWTYNSFHMPLTSTDGSGQVTHMVYNSSNQPITITDANSNVTTLTYTGTSTATVGGTVTVGDVLTLTVHDTGLAGGQQAVSYTVLTGNTLTNIATGLKNAINANTSLQTIGVTATSSAAVVTIKSTSVNVSTYTESTSGGATETIALGANSYGYLTKIDGPLTGSNDVTTISYDGFGRVFTVTDSEGYTKTFAYDAMDRPTLTTYPDITTEQTIWNKLDPVMMKDRIGRWTQKSFDQLDQLAYEIDPLGRKTQYVWCTCGSLTSLTDPAGHVTSWQHDLQGRTTQKTLQDSTSTNYVYESWTSKLLSMTDALSQTKTYFYNPDSTPYQTNYTGALHATAPVTFLWDPNFKRMTSAQKNDWGTISYTYNPYILPLGTPTTGGGMLQLVHNNVIANSDTTYTFDVLGRTTNRSINAASNSDTWTFDAMSRVTAESNVLGSWAYAYVDDTSGSSKGTTRLASVTYPNSQVTKYGWYSTTNDERLQQIANLKSSGGATISQYSHLYDAAGQITQWQQLQNLSSLNYSLGYDQAGQLTSSQAASGGPSPAYLKQNYYAYDSASNRTGAQQGSVNRVKIGGTVTTGNTLTITVNDTGLTGGTQAVTYTVVMGDTLSTIASGLAAAITANANLQAIGVNAAANGTTMSIKSASPRTTTYAKSTSGGATETITLGVTSNFVENAVIGGAKTTGNTVTITVSDPALSGGQTAITYTVLAADTLTTIATGLKTAINANSSLSTLGVTATSVGTTITIKSTSSNATTYSQSTNAGATETISLSINQNGPQTIALAGTKTTADTITATVYDAALSGGLEAVTYTVLAGDTLTSIATGLAAAINADTHLQGVGISATSAATVVTVQSNSTNPMTLRETTSAGATETVALNIPANGIQTAAIGGTKTTGNTLTITTFDAGLATGSEAVTYTVLAGDTLTSIATGLAAAITADANLSAIGVSASATSTVLNIKSTSINATTFTKSTSGGATETIALAPATSGTLYGYNNVNELTSVAAGGPTLFQATTNKALKSATVNSVAATLNWSESFTGNASLSSGTNTVPVSATDGASNVKTNNYQIGVNGPSSSTPVYDSNGNMTSDGTNTYVWDAENRLIQVTYPGSGNNSQFVYDAFSGLVKIVETTSGSITSTKQFVRCGSAICEERNASGTITKQFFGWGQTLSGSNYFYTRDHLGSVRDMTDTSGVVQAHYEYGMFGEVTQTIASQSADFGFAGMYFHAPSGLNLATFRAYNPTLGRWINRDPLEERESANLYRYVGNNPISFIDPSGLLGFSEIMPIIHDNNHSGQSDEFIACQLWQESSWNQSPPAQGFGGGRFGLGQIGLGAVTDVIAQYNAGNIVDPTDVLNTAKKDAGLNVAISTAYLGNRISNRGSVSGGLSGCGTGNYDKIKECEACLKKQLAIYGPPNIKCCLGKLHN